MVRSVQVPEPSPDGTNAQGAGIQRRAALRGAMWGAAAGLAGSVLSSLGWSGAALAAKPARRPGAGKVTITVGTYQSTDQPTWKKIMAAAVPMFEKANPGIAIQWLEEPPGINIQEKLITMYAADEAPDIIQECCAYLPEFAARGMLLSLQPYIKRDWPQNWESDFLPSQINAGQMTTPRNLGQFALPTYCGTMAMYYNVDEFKAKKVGTPDPSWTFADWAVAFTKLNNSAHRQWAGVLPWTGDDRFYAALLHPYGANLVDPANKTRCAIDSSAGLAAVSWYYEQVYQRKNLIPWTGGGSGWGSPTFGPAFPEQGIFGSKAAFVMGEGSWMLSRVVEAVAGKFAWNVAPLPVGPKGRSNLSTTDGYAIINKTKNPEQAWQVLSWFTGIEFSKLLIQFAFLQPSRKSLIPYYQSYARKAYPPLKNVDLTAFSDAITGGWAVPEQLFLYETQAMTAYAAVMSQSLWASTTSWTPEKVVTQLASQINTAETQAAAGH